MGHVCSQNSKDIKGFAPFSEKEQQLQNQKLALEIETFQAKIKKAFKPMTSEEVKTFMSDSRSQDGTFKISEDVEAQCLRFDRLMKDQKQWGWAQTGLLPRNKSLTLRIKCVGQFDKNKNWECVQIHLVGKDLEFKDFEEKIKTLRNRPEDKLENAAFYGVGWKFHSHYNMKKKKKLPQDLTMEQPIYLTYHSDGNVAIFESDKFFYYHDDIVQTDYKLIIGLAYWP